MSVSSNKFDYFSKSWQLNLWGFSSSALLKSESDLLLSDEGRRGNWNANRRSIKVTWLKAFTIEEKITISKAEKFAVQLLAQVTGGAGRLCDRHTQIQEWHLKFGRLADLLNGKKKRKSICHKRRRLELVVVTLQDLKIFSGPDGESHCPDRETHEWNTHKSKCKWQGKLKLYLLQRWTEAVVSHWVVNQFLILSKHSWQKVRHLHRDLHCVLAHNPKILLEIQNYI